MPSSRPVGPTQERGGPSQKCPWCGTVEAAGAYCTRCLAPMGSATLVAHVKARPSPVEPRRATKRAGVVDWYAPTLGLLL